jgi:hypothetical protein
MSTCGSILLKRSLLSSAANTATFRASRPLCFRHRLFRLENRAYISTMSPHKVQNTSTVANGTQQAHISTASSAPVQGDLNNTSSMRQIEEVHADPEFAYRSLAIPTEEDDPETLAKYRPFLLDEAVASQDWVAKLELATVTEMAHNDIAKTGERLKVLVLYGSLRNR